LHRTQPHTVAPASSPSSSADVLQEAPIRREVGGRPAHSACCCRCDVATCQQPWRWQWQVPAPATPPSLGQKGWAANGPQSARFPQTGQQGSELRSIGDGVGYAWCIRKGFDYCESISGQVAAPATPPSYNKPPSVLEPAAKRRPCPSTGRQGAAPIGERAAKALHLLRLTVNIGKGELCMVP